MEVDSQAEQEALTQQIAGDGRNGNNFWIGLALRRQVNYPWQLKWVWQNSRRELGGGFTYWKDGEPKEGNYCARMEKNGQDWKAKGCQDDYSFPLCEQSKA